MSARVLVVDDIPVNVKLLEARLALEYYEVLSANDGKTALEIARTQQPDIILLDVMMPDMDGYEVCTALKTDPVTAHIPVVMVTALDVTRDRGQGLEAGADDFLSKPVNDTALFARISSLVRLKRACDEWRAREATAVELGITNSASVNCDETTTGNILLAEPGMWEVETIAGILKDAGHELEQATSVEDVLALSSFGNCDLVLISDGNDSTDALRLCSQLRTQPDSRHVPILLVVDEGDDKRLAKALELGINDYLVRPVDRDELIARSRSQIQRTRYESRLRQTYVASVNAAVTDALTGLYNRRYLESHFGRLQERLKSSSKRVAALLIDIDRFKSVNDTYGHEAGDVVLRGASNLLRENLRGFDTAVRLGGEEFVVIMPDCSDHVAGLAAERLRRTVEASRFDLPGVEEPLALTISIGVATAVAGEQDLDGLLRAADQAVYSAKEQGRNCVVVSGEDAPAPPERAIA